MRLNLPPRPPSMSCLSLLISLRFIITVLLICLSCSPMGQAVVSTRSAASKQEQVNTPTIPTDSNLDMDLDHVEGNTRNTDMTKEITVLSTPALPTRRRRQQNGPLLATVLPPELLEQIAWDLAVEDTIKLQSLNKGIYSAFKDTLSPDIRILYIRFHPHVDILNQVELYHFCIRASDILIPQHYPTLDACFQSADKLDGDTITQTRLQVLYNLLHVSHADPDMLPIINHLLRTTSWGPEYRQGLLYMDAITQTYNDTVWDYFCLDLRQLSEQEAKTVAAITEPLDVPCARSILIREQALLTGQVRVPGAYQVGPSEIESRIPNTPVWRHRRIEMKEADAAICRFYTIPHHSHDAFQSQILTLIRQGANIHQSCLRIYLTSYFASAWRHRFDNHSRLFLKVLLDLGLSLNLRVPGAFPLVQRIQDIGVLQKLLESGASPNRTIGHSSPLFRACRQGNDEAAKLLLAFGADPNVGDVTDDMSPLMATKSVTVAGLLLEKGAKADASDSMGNTAFLRVASTQNIAFAKLLLDHRVNMFHVNRQRQTALMLTRYHTMANFLINCMSNETFLSLTGHSFPISNLNGTDRLGRNALHYALAEHRDAIAGLLIHAGINVAQRDLNGNAPLMLARRPHEVELVLGVGRANPNLQNNWGETALIAAVKKGRAGLVEELLQYAGVRLDLRDLQGRTAQAIAKMRFRGTVRARLVRLLRIPG